MSNLLQMAASPEQLARLKAMAALFAQPGPAGGGQPQVSDENPIAPPPAPTLSAAQPAPGSAQPTARPTPGSAQPLATLFGAAQPAPGSAPPPAPTLSGTTGPNPFAQPAPGVLPSLSTPGTISTAAGGVPIASTAKPPATGQVSDQENAARSMRYLQDLGLKPKPAVGADVMSEEQWAKEHPAPATTPYQAPTWKQRALRALASGLTGFSNPAAAERQNEFWHQRDERARKEAQGAPEKALAGQHAGYQRYIEGQEAPTRLQLLRQDLTDREATAQRQQDTRTLDQMYTDAVRADDKEKQQGILGAIHELKGAERGEETPFTAWRAENPKAPVENYFKAEKGPKVYSSPFEAFAYGSPDEKKSAKEFLTLEGAQKRLDRSPSEIEQRYTLYRSDPDAYQQMFGNKGTAQDQAQAARMLKFFDAHRKEVQGDFTLDDQTKQQHLAEIDELEKPYLAAAGAQGGAPPNAAPAKVVPKPGLNAGGLQPGEVEVISPTGQHGYIPKANLAKALKRGYKTAPAAAPTLSATQPQVSAP